MSGKGTRYGRIRGVALRSTAGATGWPTPLSRSWTLLSSTDVMVPASTPAGTICHGAPIDSAPSRP